MRGSGLSGSGEDGYGLPYGYTLDDLDRLTRKAVRVDASGAFWRGSNIADRYETAWSVIAEHLYAAQEPPAEYDLVRTGTAALARSVYELRREHGYEDNQRAFNVYWLEAAGHTGSHEPRIVDELALAQIWPRLTDRHRAVLTALAVFGDHAPAAQSLSMSTNLWSVHLSKARRAFLKMWHHGEEPSRPWGTDRRSTTPGARRKNPATRVRYRRPREPIQLTHGKAGTYQNHGCRCLPCHEAAMTKQRQRRARKKAAA